MLCLHSLIFKPERESAGSVYQLLYSATQNPRHPLGTLPIYRRPLVLKQTLGPTLRDIHAPPTELTFVFHVRLRFILSVEQFICF